MGDALALALALAPLAPAPARAQDLFDLPPPSNDARSATSDLDVLGKRLFWGRSAPPRPFVSGVADVGVLYFRPSLALGYGKPHWSWIGVEGYSSVTQTGGAEYFGLRAALPRFEARGGARYDFALGQYFLLPAARYTRDETEYKLGPRSRYMALELELSGSVPLFSGSLFAVATGYAVVGVPSGFYLYEDALHTVVKPPFVYRARLGYMGELDRDRDLGLGGAAEILGNPGRRSTIVRAGSVLSVALTEHLDAIATLMFVIASPDRLGLLGADLGQIGLRYRWATGDRWPDFP